MIEESKYYSDMINKDLTKELMMTKEDNENFENPNIMLDLQK